MSGDDWQDPGFAANWDEAGNLSTNPDRLRQLSLLADLLAAGDTRHLLDLGIGSAQVEAALHRRHPDFLARCRVTGVDASAAMLELARQRCADEPLPGIELIRGDFAALERLELDSPPDAVICVQALHEVDQAVKRGLFAWVRAQLPAGCPFYIIDRFAYPAGEWLGDWRATWDWMRAQVGEEVLEFDAYHERYRAKNDHVARVRDYRAWLADAGFESECAYRCFNRALIVARARDGGTAPTGDPAN